MNFYEYSLEPHKDFCFSNSSISDIKQILINDDNIKPEHIAIPAQFSEFYIKKDSDTLLIVVGESWTYGEGFSGIGSGAGYFNFPQQLENCLGMRMGEVLGCDLYQYSVPGNCNLHIHTELERILNYVSTLGYKKVLVAVLMTENARELGIVHSPDKILDTFFNWYTLPKTNKIDIQEWIRLYDELFFDYLNKMITNFTSCPIEAIVFRNFTKIATDKRNYNFKIIEQTWGEYTSQLINIDFTAPLLLIPIAFENCKKDLYPNLQIDQTFMEEQIDTVNKFFDIITGKIKRNPYHQSHPNASGHLVWAHNLIRKAGWKDV